MSDLVAYDTEATDADPRHGQVTQFGAVRADKDFNVLAEVNLRVRRLPWVVPMPKALEVTRMDPRDLNGPDAVSEYSASGEIERFLVPGYGVPRVMLTFNGIRFDDEMLRTTLYRNLRNPWFSSGKQTTRVDLLSIVRLVHAYDPEAISVPRDEEGNLTFRLEKLCSANGIDMTAHDALSDARATLDLGKLISQRVPWAWQVALSCGKPSTMESLFSDAAASGRPVYLFTHFGQADIVPCAVVGTDGAKKWILADLRKETHSTDPEEIAGSIFSKGTPFPVIRSNAAPIIVDAASAARMDPNIDPAGIAARAMEIKLSGRLRNAALEALGKKSAYNVPAGQTSEERIYSGFIPDRDKPSMTNFHRAGDWLARGAIRFGDSRLNDFAARILVDACRNGECELQPDRLAYFEGVCSEALSRPYAGPDARWGTLASALASGADPNWIKWAETAFGNVPELGLFPLETGVHPPGNAEQATEEDAPRQMEMVF